MPSNLFNDSFSLQARCLAFLTVGGLLSLSFLFLSFLYFVRVPSLDFIFYGSTYIIIQFSTSLKYISEKWVDIRVGFPVWFFWPRWGEYMRSWTWTRRRISWYIGVNEVISHIEREGNITLTTLSRPEFSSRQRRRGATAPRSLLWQWVKSILMQKVGYMMN